jgi:flagellar basal body P-ring formation protein FlgA
MRRLLASILIVTAPVFAGDFQPTDDIRSAALGAIGSSPGLRAEASVDDAIRLPRCAEPLEARLTTASTVEVGCAAAGWRLFVPVRIQRMEDVWVLTRPLAAGQPIDADSVRSEARDVARIAGGALPASAMVEGQVARRSLMAGSVLQSQDLVAPRAVRRGDIVTLISRIGGIEVRAAGRSLGDGGISERISVENLASRRIIQGVVRSAGEVEVAR